MATQRSFATDGGKIRRLRLALGWDENDLAERAKCSLRTVQDAEQGQRRFFRSTLKAIAGALNVKWTEIAEGCAEEAPPAGESKPVKIQILFSLEYDSTSEADMVPLIDRLSAILNLPNIEVVKVEKGSVKITVEVSGHSSADIVNLFYLFKAGMLAELGISDVSLPDSPEATRELCAFAEGFLRGAGTARYYQEGPTLTIRIMGQATMGVSLSVRQFVERSVAAETNAIRCDLRYCTRIDSAFAGALLALKKSLDRRNGRFTLVAPSPSCNTILRELGIADLLPVEKGYMEPPAEAWSDLPDFEYTPRHDITKALEELTRIERQASDPFKISSLKDDSKDD